MICVCAILHFLISSANILSSREKIIFKLEFVRDQSNTYKQFANRGSHLIFLFVNYPGISSLHPEETNMIIKGKTYVKCTYNKCLGLFLALIHKYLIGLGQLTCCCDSRITSIQGCGEVVNLHHVVGTVAAHQLGGKVGEA